MSEWSNVPAWKASREKSLVGSNPIPSAKKSAEPFVSAVFCFRLDKIGFELGASRLRRACRRQENSPVDYFVVDKASATGGGSNEPQKCSGRKNKQSIA